MTTHVEGLNSFRRACAKASPQLAAELTAQLKVLASAVAARAQQIAAAKGLRGDPAVDPHSGDLIRKIKPSVRGTAAWVRESANAKGYPYPGIYEYAGSEARGKTASAVVNRSSIGAALIAKHGVGKGTYGPRSFLRPALAAFEESIALGVSRAVDHVLALF